MQCPKCGHEQISNGTCIQCGIVFAKYDDIQKRGQENQSQVSPDENPASESAHNKLTAIFNTLRQRWFFPWQPVSTMAMVALSTGFGIMVYLLATKNLLGTDSIILHFIHDVNLVFHEAGHVIFGVFGNRTLAILGGSLNQILIPFIVACSFWGRRDTVGVAFGLFWFFENFLDIAVYMGDARALALPLIGGLGEEAHDWRNLFFRFGLIDQDVAIAGYTRLLGWVGVIATWTWLLWRWLFYRKMS